jgi:GPH family glycoside/pentoside/hexuronide:cation symporter
LSNKGTEVIEQKSAMSRTPQVPIVSKTKKLAYGMPAFALAIIGIPVYVYIPKFYTDVVGIEVALLGIILFGVRIFDAVTDPMIGYLSDRTRSRFGRRRPYIAIGAVFVTAMMVMLFNPPDADSLVTTTWFTVAIYGLFLFWTVVTVPYESLGPEITLDYHERTSLFALRDGLLIAGTLAAASSPAAVKALLGVADDAPGERAVFFWISVIYTPLLLGTCWWCVAALRELPQTSRTKGAGIFDGIEHLWANKPFLILLAAYTISAIGNNLPATLILYYVEYVLESQLADLFLLFYFVTGILFLPGWIWISRRTGKKAAWIASMAINTGAFSGVFFLGPGDTIVYGILVCLSGIGFGATLAIPSAIQADVIDYDELLSGERREGRYIGLWSIAKKFAAALGVGIGLTLLGRAGYVANQAQSDEVVQMLRYLYALVPCLCNLVGLLIALYYPINEEMHGRIREAIGRRKEGVPSSDPLRGTSSR